LHSRFALDVSGDIGLGSLRLHQPCIPGLPLDVTGDIGIKTSGLMRHLFNITPVVRLLSTPDLFTMCGSIIDSSFNSLQLSSTLFNSLQLSSTLFNSRIIPPLDPPERGNVLFLTFVL
jgi:hypothetical protein